jgi:hypothetical protein
MTRLKSRVERLEKEYRFGRWFHFQRYLEGLSLEQLEGFATRGFCPGPPPEPLPPGGSKLDGLDRKTLIELWEEDEHAQARFARRSSEDQKFFCVHGHWPERACGTECMTAEEREHEIQNHFGRSDVLPK